MNYEFMIKAGIFFSVVFLSFGIYTYFTTRKNEVKNFLEDVYVEDRRKNTIKTKYLKLVRKIMGEKKKLKKLEELLLMASIERYNAEEILGISLALGIATGISFFVIMMPDYMTGMFFGSLFGLLAYKIPVVIIVNKARKRIIRANEEVLGYSEMLSTAMDAGLSINQAIKKICQYSEGVLVEEFDQAIGEMAGGETKKAAFENIIRRLNKASDVILFIESILQAEESGQSIRRVLAQQSESIRNRIENKATELAQKANIKLLAPIVVFILLPMMVLIIGPALMQLGDVLVF